MQPRRHRRRRYLPVVPLQEPIDLRTSAPRGAHSKDKETLMLSNEARAALATAAFTFLAVFGAAVIGWIQTVVDWANAGGVDVFPSVSVLGKAAVAAAAGAATGLLNFAYRWLQSRGVPLPGAKPEYVPPT